ncbi:MAG: hypothetical protein ACFB10_26295 [Salibacteraceae bacterium]
MQWLNKVGVGFALGLIGPVPGFVVYYLILWSHKTLWNFFMLVVQTPEIQSKVLALSLISNLAIFLIFFRSRYDHTARGVLFGTFVYVPIMLYLRLT